MATCSMQISCGLRTLLRAYCSCVCSLFPELSFPKGALSPSRVYLSTMVHSGVFCPRSEMQVARQCVAHRLCTFPYPYFDLQLCLRRAGHLLPAFLLLELAVRPVVVLGIHPAVAFGIHPAVASDTHLAVAFGIHPAVACCHSLLAAV